jgi:predicted nucleic acid-binding Zn finger protein
VQVPLWSGRRLLSLWDLMKDFRACQFWWMSQELLHLQTELVGPVDKAWVFDLTAEMDYVRRQCEHIGLKTTDLVMVPFCNIASELQRFQMVLDYQIDVEEIKRQIKALRKNLELELDRRKFVQVAQENTEYFEQEKLFGEAVYEKFESARQDIKDAGNCMAVDSGTAAVFHLMRAVEWGLRALCKHLGLLKIRKSKKPGHVKYVPMEYAEWEKILEDMHDRVNEKLDRLKRGKAKQEAQEFYYPLLQDLKGFKDAWRNHVMHTRQTYTVKDAEAIMDHVRRFLSLLATRVSE